MSLQDKINTISSGVTNLSGITFPDATTVIRNRIKNTHGLTDEQVNQFDLTNSPALSAVTVEIAQAKTAINFLMSQLPFLSVPIHASTAINNIKQQLPLVVSLLARVGVEPPAPLEPVLDAITTAETLITTAGAPLTGVLAPVKSIVGL